MASRLSRNARSFYVDMANANLLSTSKLQLRSHRPWVNLESASEQALLTKLLLNIMDMLLIDCYQTPCNPPASTIFYQSRRLNVSLSLMLVLHMGAPKLLLRNVESSVSNNIGINSVSITANRGQESSGWEKTHCSITTWRANSMIHQKNGLIVTSN